MRYDLTPPPKPPGDAPLAYADSLTDSQADLFSADREMTWRLSRANGWAAVGIGALAGVGFCVLQSTNGMRPTTAGMLAMLAVPVAMIVPGAVLLSIAGKVRGGGRGSVIAALVMGVWLSVTWLGLAAALVFSQPRTSFGRTETLVAVLAPLPAFACLLVPAAKLVYHAARVLSYGGRAGMRDQTSGLDVAVTATDQDLWRLVARTSLLRLAGSCVLLVLALLCIPATLIQRPPAPPEPAPQGTSFNGDFYGPNGLPRARRQQIVDTLDRDQALRPEQRRQLDDLLRHVGTLYDAIPRSAGFAWDRFVPTSDRRPAVVDRLLVIPSVAGIEWRNNDEPLMAWASNVFTAQLSGDGVRLVPPTGSATWEWSWSALERWAQSLPGADRRPPTREQIETVRQSVAVPQPPPDGTRTPPPVWPAPEGAMLEDGSLRVNLPDIGTRFIDADGAVQEKPWSQRQAEAEAARPKLAWLPISPAWPAVLCLLALAGMVAAYRAIAESRAGRRGEPVELTEAAARRLLTPQTVLSLVSALGVMIVAWKVLASGPLPRGVGTSVPAALLALAAGGWVFWTAMVLPRRAIDLARER